MGLGLTVAGNSGLSAGGIGRDIINGKCQRIGTRVYRTQEENFYAPYFRAVVTDIYKLSIYQQKLKVFALSSQAMEFNSSYMPAWLESFWSVSNSTPLIEKPLDDVKLMQLLLAASLEGRWGMRDLGQTMDARAFHGTRCVDYTTTTDPAVYSAVCVHDVVLPKANLSRMSKKSYIEASQSLKDGLFPAVFINGAGPNANSRIGRSTGTMRRTLNQKEINDYGFFRECVAQAVLGKVAAAAKRGVTHLILDKTSCGIYSGSHKSQINSEFRDIVNEALDTNFSSTQSGQTGTMRQCFKKVIIAGIK